MHPPGLCGVKMIGKTDTSSVHISVLPDNVAIGVRCKPMLQVQQVGSLDVDQAITEHACHGLPCSPRFSGTVSVAYDACEAEC